MSPAAMRLNNSTTTLAASKVRKTFHGQLMHLGFKLPQNGLEAAFWPSHETQASAHGLHHSDAFSDSRSKLLRR